MGKHQYSFDEEKIQRFIRERRGMGQGKDYRPWLTVHDVSSSGRSTRIHSAKTQREHHLLSDIETSMFLMVEWAESVIDIREQFPLDRDETKRIAHEMSIPHPADPHSRCDIVMTTDFLLDIRTQNGSVQIARSIKPFMELEKSRILDKQELERRYWEEKNIDWGIVTDIQLPKQRIKNLRWLHEYQTLDFLCVPYATYWEDKIDRFLGRITQSTGLSIREFFATLENSDGFNPGEALTIFRHLAARKAIRFDLDIDFRVSASVDTISIKRHAHVTI